MVALSEVSARTLVPAEVPTPLKLLKQVDCYQQVGVKYPQRGTFHSYAELLHFALSEGECTVTTIIPQPFRLRVSGKPYVPDAYLVRGGQRIVVELKPRGEFDDALRLPLQAYFEFHAMQFEVIANEAMVEREIEALNWLHVIRTLSTATAISSEYEEREVWTLFLCNDALALGDVLDSGDRIHGFARELALYRLLHRGRLQADWLQQRLSLDTVIRRCA